MKRSRSKIQDTLNRVYTFRTLQPPEGMDCYQFSQDNFQRLNGKLYPLKADSNYLLIALMKDDDCGIWKFLKLKSLTLRQENKKLLATLQTHFHVSNPFALEKELHVDNIDDVGTLNRLPKQEIKHILTGLVRKTDADYMNFYSYIAKTYTMEIIPTSINVMVIEYFLPKGGGCIDGYYKFILALKRDTKVSIYRTKMKRGEFMSYSLMT